MYWNWIRAQFNPRDIHLHGTRINSTGARDAFTPTLNFFSRPLHFSVGAVTKIGSRREIWWLSSHVKSREARAIIARVILPRVSERKAIRCAKLYTASLREVRGIGREGGSKISNGGGRGGRASGGFAIVSDTRDFCERRNFSKLFRRRKRVLWVLGARMRSLCLCAHRVVLSLAPNTQREVDL